jgi:hypothetical protein
LFAENSAKASTDRAARVVGLRASRVIRQAFAFPPPDNSECGRVRATDDLMPAIVAKGHSERRERAGFVVMKTRRAVAATAIARSPTQL